MKIVPSLGAKVVSVERQGHHHGIAQVQFSDPFDRSATNPCPMPCVFFHDDYKDRFPDVPENFVLNSVYFTDTFDVYMVMPKPELIKQHDDWCDYLLNQGSDYLRENEPND